MTDNLTKGLLLRILIGGILSGVGLTAHAQSMGFYEVHQASGAWAEVLQAKQSSVLKIKGKAYFALDMQDQASRELLETRIPENRTRIQECEAQSKSKCLTIIGDLQATGFLIEDGRCLWTAAHIVDPFLFALNEVEFSELSRQQRQTTLLNYPLPYDLYNSQGEKIFDSSADPSGLKVYASYSPLISGSSTFGGFTSDGVKLCADRILGPALEPSREYSHGEELRIVGYPAPSSSRGPRFQRPDSDGSSLYWTEAQVITAAEGQARVGEDNPISFFRTEIDDLIVLSGDGREGMSGAPILNQNGQVVGLFNKVVKARAEDDWPSAMAGIGYGALRFIEIYSENYSRGED